MNIKSRRALRAVAAIALTGSLLGVQALTSSSGALSSADPLIWSGTAPSDTGYWSNVCPTDESKGPVSIHSATSLNDTPASTMAAHSYAAGQNGLPDVGWQYSPANTATVKNEGGLSFGVSTTTTALSIAAAVSSPGAAGRLVINYVDSTGKQYVGEQQITATDTTWHTLSAGTMTWWRQWPALSGGTYWGNPSSLLNFNPMSATLSSFFSTYASGGSATGSFQLGCTGAFVVDDLSITDSTGQKTYDLQNPATNTVTTGSTTVAPGGKTTITGVVKSGATTVTEGALTLWNSTDNGTTWTQASYFSTAGTRGFVVYPTRNTQYAVSFNGTANYAPSNSTPPPAIVNVAPTLGLRADRSVMNVKTAATFTATFKPVRSAVPVTFQQKVGTGWQTIGTANTNDSGIAVFKAVRAAAGVWTVRATAATQSGLLAANAPTTTIKVYQPVTIPISASPRTLYVGGSIRISGVLTQRLGGVPVQLQQRVGSRWITYASSKTGARGAYSFTRRANSVGTATFRVIAPASGYRRAGASVATSVRIISRPVYYPPPSGGGSGGGGTPPPPPPGGGIG